MLLNKHKKNHSPKGNRLLVSITVLGSAGPIRFVVNEEELVAAVIDTALKSYAREGRLPILGSNFDDFLLYCPNYGSDGEYFFPVSVRDTLSIWNPISDMLSLSWIAALSPWDTIGSQGARNFLLCKKPQGERTANDGRSAATIAGKGGRSWKSWINKSFSLKISSHWRVYNHWDDPKIGWQ